MYVGGVLVCNLAVCYRIWIRLVSRTSSSRSSFLFTPNMNKNIHWITVRAIVNQLVSDPGMHGETRRYKKDTHPIPG